MNGWLMMFIKHTADMSSFSSLGSNSRSSPIGILPSAIFAPVEAAFSWGPLSPAVEFYWNPQTIFYAWSTRSPKFLSCSQVTFEKHVQHYRQCIMDITN